MGALYVWLAAKTPPTRAREMLYLLRLGFEVQCGSFGQGKLAGEAKPTQQHLAGTGGAKQSLELPSSVDLDALCNPKLPGHRK